MGWVRWRDGKGGKGREGEGKGEKGRGRSSPNVRYALTPLPGRGSFCPGNVKIDHRAWIYGCSLLSVLYFVLCLSVTHDLT